MVLLIKNKVASVEDVAHLSLSPAGRVAKRYTQSLRNAGVSRAKPLPHTTLVADGRSKHRVETARRPGCSISAEPASPTTAPTVGSSSPMTSSSSPVISDTCSDQWEEDEDHFHRLRAVAQSWLDFEQLFPQRCADSVRTTEQARHDFCNDLIHCFSDCLPTSSSIQVDRRSGDLADLVSPPSSHLASRAPHTTSLTGQTTVASTVPAKPARSPKLSDEEFQHESDNFSFRFNQEEEWTPEVESRMQNAIDRLLSDAMRQLAIPVPNFSVQFPDDILADSVAHQTAANIRTSRSGASSLEDYDISHSADREDEEDDGLLSLSPALSSPVCSATPVIDPVTIPVSPVQLSPSSQMDDRSSDKEQDNAESMVEDIGYGIDNVWEELPTYVPRPLTPISEESLADESVVEADARSPPLSFECAISPLSIHGDTTEVGSMPASTSLDTRVPFAPTRKTLHRMRKFVDLKNPVTLPTLQSASSMETLCEMISVHKEDCQDRRIRRVPGCIYPREAFGGSDISIEPSPSLFMVSECPLSSLSSCFSFEERQQFVAARATMGGLGPSNGILPMPPTPPVALALVLPARDAPLISPMHVTTIPVSFHSLLNSHRAIVAFFTSATCAPCRMIKPVFEELSKIKNKPDGGTGFAQIDLSVGLDGALCLSDLEEGPKVQTTTKSSAKSPVPPKPPDLYPRRKRRRWIAGLEEGHKVPATTKGSARPPIPPKPPDLYPRRKRRRWVADLEGPKVQSMTKSSTEPPIPPKPPDLYPRRKRRRWVAGLEEGPKVQTTTKRSTKPPIPPKPPDSYLRRKRRRWVEDSWIVVDQRESGVWSATQ